MKAARGGKIDPAFQPRRQAGQMRLKRQRILLALKHVIRWDRRYDLPFRKLQEILKEKMAFAFRNLLISG